MSRLNQILAAFAVIVAALLLRPEAASAQTTITADWTALGKTSMAAITNGTVLNTGVNAVTITTSHITDGDANDGDFAPYYSTDMLAYYSGQIGSQTGVLLYSMDHSVFDVGDYFQSVYTLDTAVTNLRFTVFHVDRSLSNPYYHDGVVIEYDTGNGTWQNLRSLTSAYTTGSTVGNATLNGQAGFQGTASAGGTNSTNGNIAVNFGTTAVKRVRIRYMFGQGSPSSDPAGAYQYIGLSDFVWTQSGVSTSDLSMTKTVSNAAPAIGNTVSFTLRLNNGGPAAANNVTVRDVLPTGFDLVSTSGYGTYDSNTGTWTVASVASGGNRQITLTGTVSAPAGVTVTNVAYVLSSPNYDPDSIPGNALASEDDYASSSFTVQGTRTAGIAPQLMCPRTRTVFDWDTRSWTAGSLSHSYQVANLGTVNFAITSNGIWVNDAAFGGQSPSLSTSNTGGLPSAENSLHQYLDFTDIYQTATTTISLSTATPGAQFTVFDVDYAANDFADKLTVTGSLGGATVMPTLTNGSANYIVGNTAVGDSSSSNTQANGNVVVTFNQPVDTITIVYGNANTAPADPDGQAIALHDITFCDPSASLSVTKVSAIASDPVNGTTNPRSIPGALVEYLITVSNTGGVATDTGSVVITDDGPTGAKICFNTLGSGQPLVFTDSSPASGLALGYVSLNSSGDSLQFSADDGASWTYVPVPDADGCDGNVTNFRLTPTGQFQPGTSFTLRSSYRIE